MTWPSWLTLVGVLSAGAVVAGLVARRRLRHADPRSMRTNVRGEPVPVVLGEAIAAGGVAGVGVALLVDGGRPMESAVLVLVAVLYLVGARDDRRGDEGERGFRGHLRALARGRVTGGGLKLVAGGIVALAAGAIVGDSLRATLEIALCVALFANLLNLLDRAPGRALKAALVAGIPLLIAAPAAWAVAAGGVLAAGALVLPADLREKGMIGDAGANPLGGVLGLGSGVALDGWARTLLVLVLLALNLASERWSFSDIIRRSRVLHRLDMLGRIR